MLGGKAWLIWRGMTQLAALWVERIVRLPAIRLYPMWKWQTGIEHPLGLLLDECHLLGKDYMYMYIIRNNMHMGLRKLQRPVVINCAGFGPSGYYRSI